MFIVKVAFQFTPICVRGEKNHLYLSLVAFVPGLIFLHIYVTQIMRIKRVEVVVAALFADC